MAVETGPKAEGSRGATTAAPPYLTLFGALTLRDGQHPISIAGRRSRALLAMLALESGRPLAREKIIRLLWPGRFEAQAKASLRQCLLELNKLCERMSHPVLTATREHIVLVANTVRTDLDELVMLLESGCTEKAIAILHAIDGKPLLDEISFGAPFQEWLIAARISTEKRLRASVMHAASELDRRGEQLLRTRLLEALSNREPAPPIAPGLPEEPTGLARIAVLPFEPLDGADGPDYFADGVVDELITALGQVPQLAVAGRTSSFHFRKSGLPLESVAEALRVSHLIEGSVQRQGERVRIHARLIVGATGFELWGGRFDGALDDVFALQERVAQAVTTAIGAALGIVMRLPAVREGTQSKAAYDLYLQGRALGARVFGSGTLDRAIALFERALALDPGFAECWAMLAEAHQLVAVYTQCPDRNAASKRMADCASRAIELAPGLGYPRTLLGLHRWTQNDIVGALDHAYEGYRREPTDPAVTMRLGSFLIYCGRTRDATPYIRAALDQDPVDPRKHTLLWAIHMANGDLEAAREVGQRIVDLGWPSIHLAVASAALGQHVQAIEQYQLTKLLVNSIILPPVGSAPMTPEAMDAYWLLAAKGVCSGQEVDRQLYSQWLEVMFLTLPDCADLAITAPAILTGNAKLTFKALESRISPANMLALVALWADVDPIRTIREHSDFMGFAERIGMVAAWEKYGWPDALAKSGALRTAAE